MSKQGGLIIGTDLGGPHADPALTSSYLQPPPRSSEPCTTSRPAHGLRPLSRSSSFLHLPTMQDDEGTYQAVDGVVRTVVAESFAPSATGLLYGGGAAVVVGLLWAAFAGRRGRPAR